MSKALKLYSEIISDLEHVRFREVDGQWEVELLDNVNNKHVASILDKLNKLCTSKPASTIDQTVIALAYVYSGSVNPREYIQATNQLWHVTCDRYDNGSLIEIAIHELCKNMNTIPTPWQVQTFCQQISEYIVNVVGALNSHLDQANTGENV